MTGIHQPFDRGTLLYSGNANGHGPQIYVLFSDGTVGVHPAAASTG